MKTITASEFYNAAGVLDDNLPFSQRSEMLVDRIRKECESLIFRSARTLEIGCGNGRYSFAFEKMGAIATGIDCADEIIEFARDFAERNHFEARFICDDALAMPFQQNEFDIVFLISNNIIEFSIPDIDLMCQQIRKVLKDSGVFCIEMNDGYLHNNGKTFRITDYHAETGVKTSYYEIPEKGVFEYHSYLWTISMARFICARYFSNIYIKQLDEKRFWLECKL